MIKPIGFIISLIGFVALIYTGITYLNNSESFGLFGMDIAVSKGDPVPIIISAIILIGGLLITQAAKK